MKHIKMLSILQGILFLFIGIISFVYPTESLSILSLIFQLLLITLGSIKLIKTLVDKRRFRENYMFILNLFEGIIFIIVAILFYSNENLSILSFSIILGLWCAYISITLFLKSFKGRSVENGYLGIILSFISLCFALMVIFKPYVVFLTLSKLIGIYFICTGIEVLFVTLYIESKLKRLRLLGEDSNEINIDM
ncbi:acid-resistance membrane protein [Clostridium putrefaciens]|uniref:Acid-resistance membrane protein n=1 Tax=Clostridium putrefaciens TaxID=99675 RepID=A0A381J7S4_9CLOT|nr:DUF308 domain-containing protein [Clostridium putrefaciens]SUY47320.1 acid-resistance membrane protein [Clostridium putrefaciens]